MYPISNGYKSVIYSGDARHKLKLLFNGVEYQSANSKVESVKRTSKILSDGGERFSLDNFKAQELEIVINGIDLEDIIEPVSVSIGTLVNNAYEYVPIGIFNLNEKPQTNSGKTTIKLIDNAVKFDVPYNAQDVIEENGGEASLLQILQDICTKCEVTLSTTDFVNKDTKVSVWDNSINARQYVMYIAEIAGRIATINRSGELELIDLQKGSDIEVEINNPTEINDVLPRPINGLQLKGNTYQQTYTGKNLLKNTSTNSGDNNYWSRYSTFDEATGTLTRSTTSTSENFIVHVYNLKNNTKYTVSFDIKHNGYVNGAEIYVYKNPNVRMYRTSIPITTNFVRQSFTFTTDNTGFEGAVIRFDNNGSTQSGTEAILTIKNVMLVEGEDTDFEPYVGGTASPNPDYPQPINNVTGLQTIEVVGKNLFDKDTMVLNAFINGTTGELASSNDFRTIYFKCKPNTTYTFSKSVTSNRYIVAYSSNSSIIVPQTLTNKSFDNTFTTGNNTKVVYIMISKITEDTTPIQDILDSIQIEVGSQATTYEEYKGQSYEINFRGKNKFDGKLELGGYEAGVKDSRTERYRCANKIPVKPNTTYTFSINGVAQKYVYQIYDNSGSYVSDTDTQTGTFTTPSNCYYITFRCFLADMTSDYANLKVQLEEGDTATSYVKGNAIELNKIGDYQDYIYKNNGTWYKYKRINKYTFDGSSDEFWNRWATSVSGKFRYANTYLINSILKQSNQEIANLYCDKYIPVSARNSDMGQQGICVQSTGWIAIYDNEYDTKTLDEFKTYLSNNPIEVYYVLATPEIEEITNTDLINQLESIELLKGYNYVSIYSDNLVGGLSINYQSERQPIELDSWLFEKYTVGDKLKISRVVYEDAIRKFEHGDESEGTLYINSANPYIINQGEIDNTYSIINDLEMYSMNITKMIGNPAIDPWDMLEFEYNDNKYQFLGQNTLNYRGTIIQSFNTQIGSNAKSQENVTINAEDSKFKRIFTRIDQAEGNIELNTSQITNVQGDLEQNYYTKEQANILIQNAETGVTNTFSEAGGNNIFRNTGLWFADDKVTEYIYPSSTTYPSSDLYPLSQQHYEFWDGYVEKIKNDNSSNLSSMLLKNGYIQQKQTVPNGNYTVSFKYKKLINVATCKVFINGVEYPLTQTTDTEFVTGYKDTEGHYITQPLEVSNREIMVKFYTDADNACEIYDLMVNAGTVKLAYSQNQNETKTDTVNISKGITITSTDTDTIFKANADGIRTLNQNNNVLTEFTDTGMKTKKMEVNEEAQICGTLIKEVANQTWFTKL